MAFIRPATGTYWYDFIVKGVRYQEDTGTKDKRKADLIERDARAAAKATAAQKAEIAAQYEGGEITLSVAISKYVGEKSKLVKLDEIRKGLEWVEAQVGPNMLLSQINDNVVATLVKRKQELDANVGHNRKAGTEAMPARKLRPATINRDLLSPLRQVMRRAKRLWKNHVYEVDWGEHWLEENNEIVREATPEQEFAIMDALDRGYDDAVYFAFLTGCRLSEVAGLNWPKVNFFLRQFTVLGKRSKERVIPMTDALHDLLLSLKGNDPHYVFTFVAKRTSQHHGTLRGQRYPLRKSGLTSRWRRVLKAAGITEFRFHDIRHTKATRTLRATGDLARVQKLLGHSNINTTMRYAHVMVEDVREAMQKSEEGSAQLRRQKSLQSPYNEAVETGKVLKLKRG